MAATSRRSTLGATDEAASTGDAAASTKATMATQTAARARIPPLWRIGTRPCERRWLERDRHRQAAVECAALARAVRGARVVVAAGDDRRLGLQSAGPQ